MKRKNILHKFLLLCLTFVGLLAINEVGAQDKVDSSALMQKQWFQNTLKEREIQHLKDSITLDILQRQLQKGHSTSEQKILKQKLDSLQAKDSMYVSIAKDSIEALRANTTGVPVLFFNDTLFTVYASLGPYDASRRAKDLESKLQHLYDLPKYESDSLRTDFHEDISLVLYNGEVVAAVTYIDAIWANKDLHTLLEQYRRAIDQSIVGNRANNSWNKTLGRIGMAVLAITLMLLAIYLLNRGFMFLVKKVIRNKNNKIGGIRINNYRLFSRSHVLFFLLQLLKVLRWVVIVLLVYCAFTFILSRFPYTHAWATKIIDWFKFPIVKVIHSFINYLPKLLIIVLIIVAYRLINRTLFSLAKEIELGNLRIKGFYAEWGLATYKIVRFVLIVLTIVLIFPYLPGAHSDVFKGVSVFIGVLISIGSSSAIANTIAGLVITYMRPFKIGDWIEIGDSVGFVIEKNLLVTRLRTLQNEDITLPNTAILNGKTINYSESTRDPRCKSLVIKVEVTIDYAVNWRKVTELLLESASKTENILTEPKPFVLHKSFNNYNVGYQLNAYINQPENMFFIHSDLMHVVMDVFAKAGVEIRSPDYLNFNDVTRHNA